MNENMNGNAKVLIMHAVNEVSKLNLKIDGVRCYGRGFRVDMDKSHIISETGDIVPATDIVKHIDNGQYEVYTMNVPGEVTNSTLIIRLTNMDISDKTVN